MDKMESLIWYLEEQEPYPCLHLLEAALASRRHFTDGDIPKDLIENIGNGPGDQVVQSEIDLLLKLGILEMADPAKGCGLRLKEQMQPSLEGLLRGLRCGMELETDNGCTEAGEFLDQLVEYLLVSDADLSVIEHKKGDYLLKSEGKTYRLLLTLSPFWLPLWADQGEGQETCLIAFGPFASQAWNGLYPYYGLSEFRNRVALYDPWSRQKISLCKGSLPVHIDWYFRDRYRQRFSIPADFCEALHNMGLLRYNDER